jgi:hypothetical protein
MNHRHATAVAAAVLALGAAAPASAAPAAPPDPVINWISPVTGRDMRSPEEQGVAELGRRPVRVSTPTPAGNSDAPAVPTGPLAVVAGALALAALGAGVHRRRAVRRTPAPRAYSSPGKA